MNKRAEAIISTRAGIAEVLYGVNSNSNITEPNQLAEEGNDLLSSIHDTSPSRRSFKKPTDMKVYAVLTIFLILALLIMVEGTSWFFMASIGAVTGITLIVLLLVADKYSLASRVTKSVVRLDKKIPDWNFLNR